ncbi:hypothetical protein KUCAC02_015960 [Chaenocephalus aceratus]|uniref:Uncharacterized protein n=1 Tax=Chaenocephalus aceratus TaxID=36190 RepID=A0ACB9XZ37_CHAAC|nr:hypothetical protein KUCAC02_015960 [Chaenocephalus aceratus]
MLTILTSMYLVVRAVSWEAEPIRVVVTGAAGQIAYSLLYSIAKGDVFGKDQPITLILLDIPPMLPVLEGVVMELQDCALPLLREVIPTDKVEVGFKDIDAAILVGSMPRKEGMERKDLLKANVAIFKTQGSALDKYAKKTVRVYSQRPAPQNPQKVQQFLCRFESIPDMLELDHLTVSGDVTFGKNVSLKVNHSHRHSTLTTTGTVIIIANHGDRIDIPAGAMLENKIVSGNLRILDH